MRIHHLNCGCFCPIGGQLLPKIFPEYLLCHCLLIESSEGLILVDTGYAQEKWQVSKSLDLEKKLLGFRAEEAPCAVDQIQKLGFQIEDVRHIIPTHLDNDHAGAIYDFPKAFVHTSELELDTALNPSHFKEVLRYRDFQLKNFKKWKIHEFDQGDHWFGFQSVQAIPSLGSDLLLIPLPGHTTGHFGVAVQSANHWYFHVGDSYYQKRELNLDQMMALNPFLRSVHCDFEAAMNNLARIRELIDNYSDQVTVFSAHDPDEFEVLSKK